MIQFLLGWIILAWIAHNDPAKSLAKPLVLIPLWFYYAGAVFLLGAGLMRVSLLRQDQNVQASPLQKESAPGENTGG